MKQLYLRFFSHHAISILSLIAVILIFFFYVTTVRWSNPWGFPWVNYNEISWTDSSLDFAWTRYFNKQRFDRELLITLNNELQNTLIYRRRDLYIPLIEQKLAAAWLPDDLKYLAIAESGLKNSAVSSAGAVGLWQFIAETGQRYWLIINDAVDERLDPDKATDAAVAYLSFLYDKFGNWRLAAAAYNRGENGLWRDLERQWVDSYMDVHLNQETAAYVYRIMAIKYLREHAWSLLADNELGERYSLPSTRTITVGAVDDLASRSLEQWMNYKLLRELNPRIRRNYLSEWSRTITVLN